MAYAKLNTKDLTALKVQIEDDLSQYKARNLSLNMARGKPSAEQLDLSMDMLKLLHTPEECYAESGLDCRNYGGLEGIDEARRLMAILLDDQMENVIVGGNPARIIRHLDPGEQKEKF